MSLIGETIWRTCSLLLGLYVYNVFLIDKCFLISNLVDTLLKHRKDKENRNCSKTSIYINSGNFHSLFYMFTHRFNVI